MFELFIIQPVFNLLIGLYSIIPGGDFGVALILFTIIVRMALFPLVKRQLHQSRAMRKLQPELAKIKEETKGNKQLESARMMDLYKQHGVSPFRSIFILLIQLPIFIALFQVIRIFTDHIDRVSELTYGFLKNIPSIQYMIDNPHQFNEKLFGVIDLTQPAISQGVINAGVLIIALISAVAQYYMSRQLMPQSESQKGFRQIMEEAAEGKQTNQSEMNAIISSKMSKVFPIVMLFIMVGLPGALVLYYAVSNLVAVAQQAYVLNQDEEELEEIAESAPVQKTKKNKKQPKAESKQTNRVTRIVAKDTSKRGRK